MVSPRWRAPASHTCAAPDAHRCLNSRPGRRTGAEQAFDADVLVNIGLMHSLPGPDQTKVCALRGSGFGQTPGPSQRDADNPPVSQVGDDLVIGDAHPEDTRIAIRHSVHTTLPE